MIKRKTILLLLLVPFLLNLVFCVNFITAAQSDISKGVDIDRSNIPKNILFGYFMGGRSHVKPMLAEILAERGYNVIYWHPEIMYCHQRKDGIDEEQDYNAMKSLWEIGVISYKRTYEKYKSVVEDYNIDLIFCDLLINEACVDVANTLKKPVIVLVLALQIVDPKPYKFDPILGCNISLENESIWERFRCNFIQMFRYVYSLSDFTNQLNKMRKQMNVDLGQLTLGGFKASLVLIDTFFGFEEIGPILSEEYPPLTPELSDFINGHERVLYVSFGILYFTTTDNNSKLLQSFIEAINKKIIDGVVWALVETPKDYFYPTLKLSDGTQIQTSQILNNEHPHIHTIAEFVPQFAILNHTNTKLFFNHGGAGSAHESLYTGTPIKRKYRAADLIEYILHSSSFVEYVDDDFLKEWVPAETRMGFIRAYNLDIHAILIGIALSIIGIIVVNLIKFIGFIISPSSDDQKSKKD
ncbi:unnamed protein product [Rhizophagus irregularis]|nr:unnamed protein product [Rhizophagus irregularis]